jgi:hypothetical protein
MTVVTLLYLDNTLGQGGQVTFQGLVAPNKWRGWDFDSTYLAWPGIFIDTSHTFAEILFWKKGQVSLQDEQPYSVGLWGYFCNVCGYKHEIKVGKSGPLKDAIGRVKKE